MPGTGTSSGWRARNRRSGGLTLLRRDHSGGKVLGDEGAVSANAGEDHRTERVLEDQPAEVQAWDAIDDPAVLVGPAVRRKWQVVHPVESVTEAGSPDNAGSIDHGAVGEHGFALLDPGHSLEPPLDAC